MEARPWSATDDRSGAQYDRGCFSTVWAAATGHCSSQTRWFTYGPGLPRPAGSKLATLSATMPHGERHRVAESPPFRWGTPTAIRAFWAIAPGRSHAPAEFPW